MKKVLVVLFVAAFLAASSSMAFAQGVLYGIQDLIGAPVAQGEVAAADGIGMIDQLDPDTGDVINSFAPPIPAGGCDGLAYANGRLFFQHCGSDIYELDPATGAVVNVLPYDGPETDGLGFSGTELFILNYGGGGGPDSFVSYSGEQSIVFGAQVMVLDPNTGALLRTFPLEGEFIGGLSYGRGSIFVTSGFGIPVSPPGVAKAEAFPPVYEFDAATGDFINTIPMPEPGIYGVGYSSARGTLFVGTGGITTIHEIDPDTGAVINSFPGYVSALAADEAPALNVPGMNAWGMTAFALLAGLVAFVMLRRKTATA